MRKEQVIKALETAIVTQTSEDKRKFVALLYNTYYDIIYATVVNRLGAKYISYTEDVVAAFFEKKILKARLKNFPTTSITEFEKVLFTAVRNFCKDAIKRIPEYDELGNFDQEEDPSVEYVQTKIKEFFRLLTFKQQVIMWLRMAGLSYDRIGVVLKTPSGVLRNRFNRAKKLILKQASGFHQNEYRNIDKIKDFLNSIDDPDVKQFSSQLLFNEKESEQLLYELGQQGKNANLIVLRSIIYMKRYLEKAA